MVANDLGIGVNQTANVSAYLIAKVYGTNVEGVTSNSISFDVTTFAASLRTLYLPGNYQGWNIEQAPEYWETDGEPMYTRSWLTWMTGQNSIPTSKLPLPGTGPMKTGVTIS